MKLGLFVPTFKKDYNSVSASIWIRVYQMIGYYKSLGVDVYINNPFMKYDVSIVYRSTSKQAIYLIKYLKFTSKKVYWDTCVNYFELHKSTNELEIKRVQKISSLVDGIITSSDIIADEAKKFNDNTFVMDDPIDLKHFRYTKQHINYENPIYGWSGVSVKAGALNKYKKYIKSLYIIADKKPVLDIKFSFFKWRFEEFPSILSKIDIAVLPRESVNDPYNKGHSSFKALVFAVQGIPIVAHKIPSYEKLANYYDGIAFLEDYESLSGAILSLKEKSRDIEALKSYYSCENQAHRLLKFLELI